MRVAVGQEAPDFAASDSGGATFRLASLRGAPVLLKFFRGHW
jgi:peroxiredoxin